MTMVTLDKFQFPVFINFERNKRNTVLHIYLLKKEVGYSNEYTNRQKGQ